MIGDQETARQETAASLLSDAAHSLGRLVSGELRLARAQMAESAQNAVGGVAKAAGALVVAVVGLNVLANAAVAALVTTGLGAGPAGLIVAVVLLAIAIGLFLSAKAALRSFGLWPDRTMSNLKRDVRALRSGLTEGDAHRV